MKKLTALILALIMLLSLAACGGGGAEETEPTAEPEPSAEPIESPEEYARNKEEFLSHDEYYIIETILPQVEAEVEAELAESGEAAEEPAEETAPAEAEEVAEDQPRYEAILELYRFFRYQDFGTQEEGYKTVWLKQLDYALDILWEQGAPFPTDGDLVQEFISDPYPQLRAYALKVMGLTQGNGTYTPELGALVTEALKNEQDPRVQSCACIFISKLSKEMPELLPIFIDYAGSTDPGLRMTAANALKRFYPAEEAMPVLRELLSDESTLVKLEAAASIDMYRDHEAVPALRAMLDIGPDDPNQEKIHRNAVIALEDIAFDSIFGKNPSEEAYRALLDYLTNAPRTESLPDSYAFKRVAEGIGEDFLANAAWFDPAEFADVLTELASDEAYGEEYRNEALAAAEILKAME